jgi:predicted HAD superfamily Cof-like phosphohydrolase
MPSDPRVQVQISGPTDEGLAEYHKQMRKVLVAAKRQAIENYGKRPFDMVKEFHETYGQPIGEEPQFLSDERMELRKRLIQEEFDEFIEAVEEGDLVNAFKELADLIYVVEGTAVEMGADLDDVVTEVHLSNLSKLDNDGNPVYREDGKVLKGPHYFEPDVKTVLGV